MDNNEEIFILNALDKSVHAKAFGNHFDLKPGQIKRFRHEIGAFLDSNKGYLGLISVSSRFEDPSYAATEEGQKELAERKAEGIRRHCLHLQGVVNNLQVGLRQDLDVANIKAAVETQATDGEIAAMEDLLHYQRKQADESKIKAEKARVKLRQLASAQNAMVNKPAQDNKPQE